MTLTIEKKTAIIAKTLSSQGGFSVGSAKSRLLMKDLDSLFSKITDELKKTHGPGRITYALSLNKYKQEITGLISFKEKRMFSYLADVAVYITFSQPHIAVAVNRYDRRGCGNLFIGVEYFKNLNNLVIEAFKDPPKGWMSHTHVLEASRMLTAWGW